MYYPIICIRKWLWMARLLITLRMKARIATCAMTHCSHNSVRTRRGSCTRKFDYSAFSVVRIPSTNPPLYSAPRISPRLDATVIGRMRGKVDYLDECFDARPWWDRQIAKILSPRGSRLSRSSERYISRNACTEITKRRLRILRL